MANGIFPQFFVPAPLAAAVPAALPLHWTYYMDVLAAVVGPAIPGEDTSGRLRDDVVCRSISRQLADTREFDDVRNGTGPDDVQLPATMRQVAYVWASGWDEEDDADSGIDTDVPHRGQFQVGVRVRERDPEQRQAMIFQLQSAIKKALDGQSLTDQTVPAMTAIKSARMVPNVGNPEAAWILNGEWVGLYEGWANQDLTHDVIP